MDIGREIKIIRDNYYSLAYYFKDKNETVHKFYKKDGRIYITNFDDKGRIYLPKEFEKGILPNARWRFGYITLSAFGFVLLYRKVHDIIQLVNKIRERIETKNVIQIYKAKKDAKNIGFKDIDIMHKHMLAAIPLFSEGQIDFPKLNCIWRGYKKIFIEPGKAYINIRRNRTTLPRLILSFLGIDMNKISAKQKMVIFDLKDEVELWDKNRWEKNLGIQKWLSKDFKTYFYDNRGGKKRKTIFPFIDIGEFKFINGMAKFVFNTNLDDFILM